MFSLSGIKLANRPKQVAKARRLARALNARDKKHPKNFEKTGRAICDELNRNASRRAKVVFYADTPKPYDIEELRKTNFS